MNFELTEDQKNIQRLARDFAEAELKDKAREWDREGKVLAPFDEGNDSKSTGSANA